MLKRGVTLTETLVVVLIVTIVASILSPVLMRAKDRAKTVVCASNMRQIYLAMKLYETDFEAYPPNSVVWPAFKTYYPKLLKCPSSNEPHAEFHYSIIGSITQSMPEPNKKALQECMDLRAGSYPLIRDRNHLIPSNADLPGSLLLVMREAGSFNVVPFSKRHTLKGPCDPSLLAEESNL